MRSLTSLAFLTPLRVQLQSDAQQTLCIRTGWPTIVQHSRRSRVRIIETESEHATFGTRTLRCCTTSPTGKGKVTLVGVGPGDAHNVTPAALAAIRNADVILYDRLIDVSVLHEQSSGKPHVILESVGKERKTSQSEYNTRQPSINERIVHYAKRGLHVVRVKGGDATLFGRLADELQVLREADIDVEVEVHVVPGVTTASVVAARLQFPLTMKSGGGVCFVSGHDGAPWVCASLLQHVTLAVYMGLKDLDVLVGRLLEEGEEWVENVAVVGVQGVCTKQEKVVFGTMKCIVQRIKEDELKSPTIIIIGNAVRLAKDWPAELDR